MGRGTDLPADAQQSSLASRPLVGHQSQLPEYQDHELASYFPLMEESDPEGFEKLVQDVKARGIQEPIILIGNKILDGRNRYRAALRLEIEITSQNSRQYLGKNPLAYVISANLHRRHLTTADRLDLAAKLKPLYEAQAAERRKAGTLASREDKGRATEKAAKATGISRATLERHEELKRKAPDLAQQVKARKKSPGQAHREMKNRERQSQREKVPTPPHRDETEHECVARLAKERTIIEAEVAAFAKQPDILWCDLGFNQRDGIFTLDSLRMEIDADYAALERRTLCPGQHPAIKDCLVERVFDLSPAKFHAIAAALNQPTKPEEAQA